MLAKALGNVGETQDAAIQVEAALVDNPNNTEARIMMLRYQ
ncbi:MAG: hypothetical protein M5R36_20895 [Deltaproteobacteria bacterium]|nr:hypothetical protein [Deltaproteobacteria bacterium]